MQPLATNFIRKALECFSGHEPLEVKELFSRKALEIEEEDQIFKKAVEAEKSQLITKKSLLSERAKGVDLHKAQNVEKKRALYFTTYRDIYSQTDKFFKDRNMDVARALLSIVAEQKKFGQPGMKMRKNGFVPSFGHELDLLAPVISAMESDPVFCEKLKEIEAKEGPIEELFCAILAHDLGEEFALLPDELEEMLKARMEEMGVKINESHLSVIGNTAKRMERLTDERRYNSKEFEARFGASCDLSDMKPGDSRNLPELKDYVWPSMDKLDDAGREHLQVYAEWPKNKSEPKIYVTRYGSCPESEWREGIDFKTCYYQYHQGVMADLYCDLTKRLDTNHNLSTLIAKGSKSKTTALYLDHKKSLWDNYRPGSDFYKQRYQNILAKEMVTSLDYKRRFLAKVNRNLLNYTSQAEEGGHKIMSPYNHPRLRFELYFSGGFDIYKHVRDVQHPDCSIMMETSEAPDVTTTGEHRIIYDLTMEGLKQTQHQTVIERLARLEGVYFNTPEDNQLRVECEEIEDEHAEIEAGLAQIEDKLLFINHREDELEAEALAANEAFNYNPEAA